MSDRPEVRVVAGKLRGTRESGVAVFRGIPFAEPPVGELRFGPPEKAKPWDGVREAAEFGAPPPQAGAFGMDALAEAGDDWLTVNVWSPEPGPDARLPVMVWIQGGAYGIGTSGLPEYDGVRLASDGVVVVTFNYRVGIEGFAQLEGAPANRGLLDQVAALEWVRDNIRAFGGDPDRVTVFGQSAGGGSVASLLVMPRAEGLFRRAIAQSVPGTFFAPELAADIAGAFAGELGLRPTVDDLSTVDPKTLPSAGDAVTAKIKQWAGSWGQAAHRSIPFAPVVDGDVLPTTPWRKTRDVEIIAGHTRDEQRLFSVIEDGSAELEFLAPDPRRYRESFPGAGPEELRELVNSDWLFRMPTLHLANTGRTYLYELTWSGLLGACHGLDVPLVFGNLRSGQPAMLIEDVAAAEAVSADMRAAWIAFATHGDPGWPAYEPEKRLTRIFDTPSTIATYPEETSRLLWQDHSFEPLPLLY
ncbi:carboxylesterase/lipase family protein [Amycolatopsis xylanica]|uniref:carboxylesterase/lipase family protein n=1 Tax=Amycolatopsis xylanica TaxID=589385 RepID=UPI001FE02937|nr:carboxylesterase family protein [Amycolatopsis xylanica]